MPHAIQQFDLAKVFNAASKFRRMELDAEERKMKMESHRQQQLLMGKIQNAQRRVFQAKTPEQLQSAEADLGTLSTERLSSIQSLRRDDEDHALEQVRKKRTIKIDQNLRGAEAMKEFLDPVVTKTEAGPDVNLRALNAAAVRMTQQAQQGIIDQSQADKVVNIFRKAQRATILGAKGEMGSDQVISEMNGVAGDIQGAMQAADHGISLFGDPEKRKRFEVETEKIARMVASETGDTRHLDVETALEEQPDLFKAMQDRVNEAKVNRARAGAPNQSVTIQTPGSGDLSTQETTDQQKQLRLNKELLVKGEKILDDFDEDVFGLSGFARGGAAKAMDWVNPDWSSEKQKDFLRRKQSMVTRGTLLAYDFIVAMSGKAVTDRERAMILGAIGDISKMSATQYKEAISQIVDISKSTIGRRAEDLKMGIDLVTEPGEREFIDSRMASIAHMVKSGKMSQDQAREELAEVQKQWDLMYRSGLAKAEKRMKAANERSSAIGSKISSMGSVSDEEKIKALVADGTITPEEGQAALERLGR